MVIGSIASEERTKGMTILLEKKTHDETMSNCHGWGWGMGFSTLLQMVMV